MSDKKERFILDKRGCINDDIMFFLEALENLGTISFVNAGKMLQEEFPELSRGRARYSVAYYIQQRNMRRENP